MYYSVCVRLVIVALAASSFKCTRLQGELLVFNFKMFFSSLNKITEKKYIHPYIGSLLYAFYIFLCFDNKLQYIDLSNFEK
jgi:hypothetical protein